MKIIIIGGGIAGMYTAYKLLHKKKKHYVVEADNYLGGRIFTYRTKLHDQIQWKLVLVVLQKICIIN